MRVVSADQMRQADRLAISEAGRSAYGLMCRAGGALAAAVEELAALRGTRRVTLVTGHGNNGGDACVAASVLHRSGYDVRVLMTAPPSRLAGAARQAWEGMREAGVDALVVSEADAWTCRADLAAGLDAVGGIVVDGVLGTGCRGAPSGVAAAAIQWIQAARQCALVVAADLPSGMDSDTGERPGVAVHADVTVTFARPKLAFLHDAAAEWIGHLRVADIGLIDDWCDQGEDTASCQMMALPELAAWWRRRAWQAHKGGCGHVCVIGGAPGYAGAPVLAALGALRGGAGRVTLAAPAFAAAAAAAQLPEVMWQDPTEMTAMSAGQDLKEVRQRLSRFDVLVIGPGLSRSDEARERVDRLLRTGHPRVVVDADALYALALLAEAGWHPIAAQTLLLTPHPGEAARLLGVSTAAIMADRVKAVNALAERYHATVILKGAGTLVATPRERPWLNRTGNPGMASGGMGDLLAGVAGALWAQGHSAREAACLAVWAHGAAGDEAAWREGQTVLCATRVAASLGSPFRLLERTAPREVTDAAVS